MDSFRSTGRLQRLGTQQLRADSTCFFNDILDTTRLAANTEQYKTNHTCLFFISLQKTPIRRMVTRTLNAVANINGVKGNPTTCGNVAAIEWVAAQHAINIFLIAHLAQQQNSEHTAGRHHVTKFSKAENKQIPGLRENIPGCWVGFNDLPGFLNDFLLRSSAKMLPLRPHIPVCCWPRWREVTRNPEICHYHFCLWKVNRRKSHWFIYLKCHLVKVKSGLTCCWQVFFFLSDPPCLCPCCVPQLKSFWTQLRITANS